MSVLEDLYLVGPCPEMVGSHGICQLPRGHEGPHVYDADADAEIKQVAANWARFVEGHAVSSRSRVNLSCGFVGEIDNAAIDPITSSKAEAARDRGDDPARVLLESIMTIPRRPGEAWSDYAARREVPRSMFPGGYAGEIMFREHLAWLAGEDV